VENAVGDETPNNEEFRFQTVGEQLKAERERQGLTLTDVATRTRVPMRHLESIEKSQFSDLPGSTYTLGFTRSYARSLNMDAAKIGAELRTELSQSGHDSYHVPAQNYEPADPSRVPSKTLAWTAAAIAALLLAGYLIWRSMALDSSPAASPPVAKADTPQTEGTATPAASAVPTDTSGTVVLTATDTVWIKVYDASKKRLFESEMKAGDSFTVPADANNPMIVTGRPQAINVTIGGKALAPLGAADRTIADVGVSASSLIARKPEAAASIVPTSQPVTAPATNIP
jgi:cytoskeleton protein RodZ